jgi:hypothetical protein
MPWMSDHELHQRFARFEVMKEDLQRFIARLPSNTIMHQVRVKMLKDILKYRYEVERVAQMILTDHRKPIYPTDLMRELKPSP